MIRVGVIGYGTIGSRVADAVRLQPDMDLVGVAKARPDYRARLAASEGVRLFAPPGEDNSWEGSGIEVAGTTEDLIGESDVIVDATPSGRGRLNRPYYERGGRPAVFQGGEEPSIGEVSFVAQVNYDAAVGKRYVRVVSCNTTGLARLVWALEREFGVEMVIANLVRRAADPHEFKKGPIDATVLDPVSVPSHHAADLREVIPGLRVFTSAVKVPVTHAHVHMMGLRLASEVGKEDVIDVLLRERRITLVSSRHGFSSTSDVFRIGRMLGRGRGDVYENVVWADSISSDGRWIFLAQAIHQEAIVIPENIDAIRAVAGLTSGSDSMNLTDSTLNIRRGFLY